ncbi:MAG: alpha/beta hydrolase [Microcystaceae cyanobacterium]
MQFKRFLQSLGLAFGLTLSSSFLALPIRAADKITFVYPPFGQFDVNIRDLSEFAETGKISPSLAFYTNQVSPEAVQKLRDFLNYPFPVNSIEVYNFLRTDLGKTILAQLSKVIESPPDQSRPALSGALITAAADPQGLTFINVLKNYVLPTIPLDLNVIEKTAEQVEFFFEKTDEIFEQVQAQPLEPSPVKLQDLTQPGPYKWTTEYLTFTQPDGDVINAVVYLPQNPPKPAPLVVLAPGLNSDVNALIYAGQHLASQGLAIAALNFPKTDNQQVKAVLAGSASLPKSNEWMTQPQDVTDLLDNIEEKTQTLPDWKGKINTQNVGLLGQSLGGYTSMALGSPAIAWDNLQKRCQDLTDPDQIILNPAVIWQCTNPQSPPPQKQFKDPRVKAILAINPVTNPIFNQALLSQVTVPLFVIAGSDDIFAPAIPEQLIPFSWLTQGDRYLLLVKDGTHLSFLDGTSNLPPLLTGPKPELAKTYLKAISLAFFNRHLNQDPRFDAYLTNEAVAQFGQDPLPMRLLRSLSPELLKLPVKNRGFDQ